MQTSRLLFLLLRWAARVIGGLIVLLIVALAIGEGMPNPIHQPALVNVSFLALLIMSAGQVVAWWREGLGGLLVLLGFAGFAIANHGIRMNVVFAPMLLSGMAYLICGWFARGDE
jgi:hypothetical protein